MRKSKVMNVSISVQDMLECCMDKLYLFKLIYKRYETPELICVRAIFLIYLLLSLFLSKFNFFSAVAITARKKKRKPNVP